MRAHVIVPGDVSAPVIQTRADYRWLLDESERRASCDRRSTEKAVIFRRQPRLENTNKHVGV